MTQYDTIPLMDGGVSTIRDFASNLTGALRWDDDVVITNSSLTNNYSTPVQMQTIREGELCMI